MSEVPIPGTPVDLPVSLLALSFYAVFLLLVALRYRGTETQASETARPLGRVMFGLAALSFAYSMVLFGYSISMGSICKFCAVLYGVNLGLLLVCHRELRAQGDSFGSFLKGSLSAAFSRAGLVAGLVMAAVTGGGYLVYASLVGPSLAASKAGQLGERPEQAFKTGGRPTKGPTNAKLHIVEFADFQCPHCRIAYHEIEAVAATRTDLAVTFLHFPLDQACNPLVTKPFHQKACELAIIAECAHRQGRFFEVAPLLFDIGTQPVDAMLRQVGETLAGRIDMEALERCRTSPDAKDAVVLDIGEGLKAKVQGTPSVFLNGRQIGGALPKADLERVLNERVASPLPH
jgi:protein-disulfide isomerase